MKYYDVIIIGAGLAGCTLGNLLLKENKKVVILESQYLKNKNKLCGGIITLKAYKLLLKVYKEDIKKLDFREFNTFQVKNNEVIKKINNQTIYTIYRKDLDDYVVNQFIKNGGIILENTTYEKIDFKNKILYTHRGGVKYNCLVGADGVFSKVRYDVKGKNQKMNFAIECEKSYENDVIQIDFLDHFKGYAWFVSNSKSNLIGLGEVSENKNIKAIFLKHFNLKNDIPIRGAFLPTGNDIFLKKKNTFFIGDAAGLSSPVIGEGIYYAVSSAYHLSKAMNSSYLFRMLKDRFMIFSHRISKMLIYNTTIRNFFYRLYGKSKIISFFIHLALKTIL